MDISQSFRYPNLADQTYLLDESLPNITLLAPPRPPLVDRSVNSTPVGDPFSPQLSKRGGISPPRNWKRVLGETEVMLNYQPDCTSPPKPHLAAELEEPIPNLSLRTHEQRARDGHDSLVTSSMLNIPAPVPTSSVVMPESRRTRVVRGRRGKPPLLAIAGESLQTTPSYSDDTVSRVAHPLDNKLVPEESILTARETEDLLLSSRTNALGNTGPSYPRSGRQVNSGQKRMKDKAITDVKPTRPRNPPVSASHSGNRIANEKASERTPEERVVRGNVVHLLEEQAEGSAKLYPRKKLKAVPETVELEVDLKEESLKQNQGSNGESPQRVAQSVQSTEGSTCARNSIFSSPEELSKDKFADRERDEIFTCPSFESNGAVGSSSGRTVGLGPSLVSAGHEILTASKAAPYDELMSSSLDVHDLDTGTVASEPPERPYVAPAVRPERKMVFKRPDRPRLSTIKKAELKATRSTASKVRLSSIMKRRKSQETKESIPRSTPPIRSNLPTPGAPSHTERRAMLRKEFEIGRRAREEEREKVREEERQQREKEEDEYYKELRRKAVPIAHPVPDWYSSIPRKGNKID